MNPFIRSRASSPHYIRRASSILTDHQHYNLAAKSHVPATRSYRGAATMTDRRIKHAALFVCDIQEKFRSAIWQFDKVISTTQKMLTASEIFNIPIFETTQNKERLGDTVSELSLHDRHASRVKASLNKTKFSMCVPELLSALKSESTDSKPACIIVGIESHICVTQTALDLIEQGYPVYVLADGVSSCNREEVPIALRRLASAGVTVTSSESLLYEITGDAGRPEFKAVVGLVKESKEKTKETLSALCKI